mgnify:CR=1 FL=1
MSVDKSRYLLPNTRTQSSSRDHRRNDPGCHESRMQDRVHEQYTYLFLYREMTALISRS